MKKTSTKKEAPSNESLPCPVCNVLLKNKIAFMRHIRKFHHEIGFPCTNPECDEWFENRNLMRKHLNAAHKVYFICDICDSKYPSKWSLKRHIETKHLETLQNFRTSQKILNVEKFSDYICHLCNKHYGSKKGFILHMRVKHLKESNYSCEECNKLFMNNCALRSHIESRHTENRFTCNICSKAYSNTVQLDKHLKKAHSVPSNLKVGDLPQCKNKIFDKMMSIYNINLTDEEKAKLPTCRKRFSGPHCFKGFNKVLHLKTHNKRVHGMEIDDDFYEKMVDISGSSCESFNSSEAYAISSCKSNSPEQESQLRRIPSVDTSTKIARLKFFNSKDYAKKKGIPYVSRRTDSSQSPVAPRRTDSIRDTSPSPPNDDDSDEELFYGFSQSPVAPRRTDSIRDTSPSPPNDDDSDEELFYGFSQSPVAPRRTDSIRDTSPSPVAPRRTDSIRDTSPSPVAPRRTDSIRDTSPSPVAPRRTDSIQDRSPSPPNDDDSAEEMPSRSPSPPPVPRRSYNEPPKVPPRTSSMRSAPSAPKEKKFFCEQCGDGFFSKYNLQRHQGDTPDCKKTFRCTLCKAIFRTNQKLRRHVTDVHGEKRFFCKYCGKGFGQNSYARVHEETKCKSRPQTQN